jgi:SnoaL-like domain
MLRKLYAYLLAGNVQSVRSLFGSFPSLNAPIPGAIDGDAALEHYVLGERSWLMGLHADVRVIEEIKTDCSQVIEFLVNFTRDGEPVELPVIVVGERSGKAFSRLRIYHSTWPISGSHKHRAPIVWPTDTIVEPEVIVRYFDALASGDVSAILSTYALDGSLREPSGSRYLHAGREELASFYRNAFATPGGIPLIHAQASFNGRAFVVEYICDSWGEATFAPMAGCAVYELSADRQSISAVRIYDDVSPPE